MAGVDVEYCFKIAMEAVEKASEIVLKGFNGIKTVSTKKTHYDVVTEFDRQTEECLIQMLSKAFPDHKFIGEETTKHTKITEEPTWIIDPIDGTVNFIHGYPYSAICVALSVKKEILLGIVCNPMMKQTFTAIKGQGAFLNGKQIHCSKVEELKDAMVGLEISFGTHPRSLELYAKKYASCVTQTQGILSIGCAELSLCMIAMGVWDGYMVEYLHSWDVAPGSLIITEAGGCVLDLDGGAFDFEKGQIVCAGTEKLAHKVVEMFRC